MNRQHVLIGLVVVLAGVAVYIWTTREGTEVDPVLQETKFPYECIHCQYKFELTPQEETNMIRENGGVICPSCGKSQEAVKARQGAGIFEPPPLAPDEEPPPRPQGGLKKRG